MRQDIQSGLRLLKKNPTFTVVAVLTLALGIGATSSIFSVMNAVMLEPLGFRDSGQLFRIQEVHTIEGSRRPPTAATTWTWQEDSESLTSIGAISTTQLDFQLSGQRIRYGLIYLDTLPLLGVDPLLGATVRSAPGLMRSIAPFP